MSIFFLIVIPLIFPFRILAARSSTANTNSNGENGPQSYRFYRAVIASVNPVDCVHISRSHWHCSLFRAIQCYLLVNMFLRSCVSVAMIRQRKGCPLSLFTVVSSFDNCSNKCLFPSMCKVCSIFSSQVTSHWSLPKLIY